jgi:hypothetical protein
MPTTHSQSQDTLEDKMSHLEKQIANNMTSLHNEFNTALEEQVNILVQLFRSRNFDPNPKELHSSHYEHNQSSRSPWGSPPSWTKVLKVDMHKFDGFKLAGWVSQMEQYFSLHNIQDDETKLHIGFFYFDQERWKWCQWHKKFYLGHPTWNMFSKVVCACFDRES